MKRVVFTSPGLRRPTGDDRRDELPPFIVLVFLSLVCSFGPITESALAQHLSFRNFVRGGVHTGNQIEVPYVTNLNVSAGYWGGTVSPRFITWPRGSGVEYGHTMSFIVAAEVTNEDGRTMQIISESYNRGGGDGHPSGSHRYFFNAIPGYYNMRGDPATRNKLNDNADDRAQLQRAGRYFVGGINDQINFREYPAQSNVPESWPAFWPPGTYVGDDRPPCEFVEGSTCQPGPGLRAGRWNGAFGAFVRADQESYYVADDRDNDEFPYYPFLNPQTGEPDRRPWAQGGRRGLGVEVTARQYQWSSILAEDIFISTFDVVNVSRQTIPRTITAMIVDYDIGGHTGDNQAWFDTMDNITYQWLKRNLVINGFRVGYAGVGFLESPGRDDDGIDNDGDGITDESQQSGRGFLIEGRENIRAYVQANYDLRRFEQFYGPLETRPAYRVGRWWTGDEDLDWVGFEDLNGNGVWDPGEPCHDDVGSDGIGPEDEDWPGPDPDGTECNGLPDPGEPNFEFTDNHEIDQIGLTSMVVRTPTEINRDIWDDALFWQEYIQPGTFIIAEETPDIIYVYGSGVVDTPVGHRLRFSLAFFCGNDFQDMLRNKRTMQNIYDADYSFARPPRTPIVTAVAGDRKVSLVWDQNAELSRDPIYGLDFEMYKVYRSTEPEFNDVKTITDAFGNPLLWDPLKSPRGEKVQFDLKNGLYGAHPVPIGDFGVTYDMGIDSGLEYSYVDPMVENGRTYYYCVVSVDQGYHPSFYERGISPFQLLTPISPTESSKIIEVDAFDRPINVDRNCAVVVPQRPALGYVEPHLVDGEVQRVSGIASGRLDVEFLIPDEANSKGYEYEVTFTDDAFYETLDAEFLKGGRTTGFTLRNATTGDTLAAVQHPTARAGLFEDDALRARTYDGMKFTIDAPTLPVPVRTEWLTNRTPASGPRGSAIPRTAIAVSATGDNTAVPRDYEIRVSQIGADTSNSLGAGGRIPTNFSIWDVTNLNNPRKVPFQFTEAANPLVPGDSVRGMLSPGDVINVRITGIDFGAYRYYARSTWRLEVRISDEANRAIGEAFQDANELYALLVTHRVRGMQHRHFGAEVTRVRLDAFFRHVNGWYDQVLDSLLAIPDLQTVVTRMAHPSAYLETFARIRQHEMPVDGDVFVLETSKPFTRDDVLRFRVDGHRMVDQLTADMLNDIYVVPDPYVAVNTLEPRNILLSGRGERRIDFRNLPSECTIRIFTMSGRQVKVIHHSAPQDRSIATWNLQSDDGLDVAFGVYIYHVEAPGVGERIGRFSIIK